MGSLRRALFRGRTWWSFPVDGLRARRHRPINALVRAPSSACAPGARRATDRAGPQAP